MAYGLLYQCTFDPPSGASVFFKPRYRLEILQKDYSGAASNVIGGETPVIHTYQTDNPYAPVRGSSLSINLINKGSLPLSSFFSVNADEFKVRFYWTEHIILLQTIDRLLFEGFIVQDDCSEIMVDFTHEINLSANDGLGLLKDIDLDKAPGSYDYFNGGTTILMATAPHLLRIGIGLGIQVQSGDKIEIIGTGSAGIYSIASMIPNGLYLDITTVEAIPTLGPTSTVVNILRNNLLGYVSLLSVIKRCLSATGLELKTNIYCNLLERLQLDTSSFLDQTLVDNQTFLKNDTDYDNCYSVLEKILDRFNLSLFQAEGVWNIVRWDELRYYANLITGFSYDSDMVLIGPVTLPTALNAGIGEDTRAAYGLQHRVLRPYDFDKETFNYKQPAQLLRNFNLQQLGNLLRSYTTGSGVDLKKIYEYEMPWWYGKSNVSEYFIRVIKDSLDNEIERYASVNKDAIYSYKIEANKGDHFSFSLAIKPRGNLTSISFTIKLTDGIQTKYYGERNQPDKLIGWWDTASYPLTISGSDWQPLSLTTKSPFSSSIPFDGLLTFELPAMVGLPASGELLYKDIRFEYTAFINESTKIIGQTNTSTQVTNTKNNKDGEIFIDSSPRSFIAGTLFLNQMTGLLQKRTTIWKRQHIPLEQRKLGYITTFETLFWRRVSRSILEGSFVGLLHDNKHNHVSLLSVFKYTHGSVSTCNFIFGKFEIDYKHDMINNSPMWEIYKDGEVDADLTSTFELKYLYDQK